MKPQLTLRRQNDKMKHRLASLGFAMALEPVPNFKWVDPHAFHSDEAIQADPVGDSGTLSRKTASSQTAGRSTHLSGRVATAPLSPFGQRPLKRQRLDSPIPGSMQFDHPTSREAMPPPPKPRSRMQSVRKIFPTLRKRFSRGHFVPTPDNSSRASADVRMYDTEHWRIGDDDQSSNRDGFQCDTPDISDSLPIEQSEEFGIQCEYQTLSRPGIDGNGLDRTFQSSSPIKSNAALNRHQPVQLPTEPSYIRLMDGLSHDTGIELGLKDPREDTVRGSEDIANKHSVNSHESGHRQQDVGLQNRWSLGHRSLDQSHGFSLRQQGMLNPRNVDQTDGHINKEYPSTFGPVTPKPSKYQQPGRRIENVVSPFFKSNYHRASAHSRSGFAEPQHSSNRFGASPSQRYKVMEPRLDFAEPRSLNGLSFCESPVNSQNERIQYSQERKPIMAMAPLGHHQSRNLDSRGFIIRPEIGRLHYDRDSAYSPVQNNRASYSRQMPTHSQPAISTPAYKHLSYSRSSRFPSAMPSVRQGPFPKCTQPPWESLQRMGVRTSHSSQKISQDRVSRSARRGPSSAHRRRIRP